MNTFAGRKPSTARAIGLVVFYCTFGLLGVMADPAKSWPKEVAVKGSPEIDVIREDSERNQFVYRSTHYEFVSDVRLSKGVVSKFALLFEATYAAVESLPLGHTLRVPGHPRETHFRTRLFLTDASYRKAGGPSASSGVFVGRTGEVLVPMSSLGVKSTGRRVVIDPKKGDEANKTLVHELVHQLTAMDQGGMHLWYREGLAEYLSTCPYKEGSFSFEDRSAAVQKHLHSINHAKCIQMIDFLPISRILFKESQNRLGPLNTRHYQTALLLVDFLFHHDSPSSSIQKYIQAVQSGTEADAALPYLLAGRSYGEFQADLAAVWRDAGLHLTFEPLDRPSPVGLDRNPDLNPR